MALFPILVWILIMFATVVAIFEFIGILSFLFTVIFILANNNLPPRWLLILFFIVLCFRIVLYLIYAASHHVIIKNDAKQTYKANVKFRANDSIIRWLITSVPFDMIIFLIEFTLLSFLLKNSSITGLRSVTLLFLISFVLVWLLKIVFTYIFKPLKPADYVNKNQKQLNSFIKE